LKQTSEARGQFKTPTLRNIELTAPYMHGGHFDTLEQVVRFYSTLDEMPTVGHREEMLEPLGLSEREIEDLVAFLKSLTGTMPEPRLLRPPESPVPDTRAESAPSSEPAPP
jgi:cytochrome c peroxidase